MLKNLAGALLAAALLTGLLAHTCLADSFRPLAAHRSHNTGGEFENQSISAHLSLDAPVAGPDFKWRSVLNLKQQNPINKTGKRADLAEVLGLQVITNPEHLMRALARREQVDKLPVLKASFNEDDPFNLHASKTIFYNFDAAHGNYRFSEMGLMGIVAKSRAMVYNDLYIHRYDNFNDLKLAADASVNQEECIKQLAALEVRARRLANHRYQTRDINIFQLLDTWASKSSGLLMGNTFFEGLYNECLRLKIVTDEGAKLPTRYCVAHLKVNDWPRVDKYDILSLKKGICLPKSCDSSDYKNKFQLLLNLMEYNTRVYDRGQLKMHSLYCLPDEASPLRSVWNSPKAVATISGLALWFCLLAYCTYKHHKTRDQFKGLTVRANFGLSNMNSASEATDQQGAAIARFRIYQMFSITHNARSLLDTEKESSLVGQASKLGTDSAEAAGADGELEPELSAEMARERAELESRSSGKIIDLNCIEGIKVIAMSYVIMGHVLMCMTSLIQNGREWAHNTSVAYLMANLAPAFAVNTFFSITGMLTSYLMLKQNQTMRFVTSPAKWAAFFVYRYLRIMPMYALVVLYCKTLAKYTGSGPIWDYATSSLGQRRTCEQEPWSWTLLFRANFLSPLEHCIPGGWYLANDFQFFLVTPLFLALLALRPRMGQLVLFAGVLLGYSAGFHSIFSAPIRDLRPIAKFAPHGFKTYVSHLSTNYTHPQYRIPAYLIGLLVGYNLFVYERNKLEFFAAQWRRFQRKWAAARKSVDRCKAQEASELEQAEELVREPDWPEAFKRFTCPVCLCLVVVCCVTPLISAQIPFTSWGARFLMSLILPLYHVVFASAVGLYLLLATTGQGNKNLDALLSASIWKPLARVSLCVVLVNVEVINYIVQSNTNLHYNSNQFHISLNFICIAATYAVALVICVLFEAPIRAALNTLLTKAIKRASPNGKKRCKTA